MAKKKQKNVVQPPANKNSQQSSYSKPRIYLLAALAATFAVYIGSALQNQITHWDDGGYLTNNTIIQSWNSGIFTAQVAGNWAPMHMLALAVQYHFFKLNPAGYHLVSLLLHLVNVTLVFFVVRKINPQVAVAGIVALFFGIHPMHVESVAWISAQKDSLYTGFYLAAMLMYCISKEPGKSVSVKYFYLSLTMVFFMLSCLAKGMGVTLPVVLVLIDSLQANSWNWKFVAQNSVRKLPFFAVAIAFGVIAWEVQKKIGSLDNPLDHTFAQQFMFACYGLWVYLVKFVAPFYQSPLYPYPLQDSAGAYPFIYYLSPVIVAIIGGLILWYIIRRNKEGKPVSALVFGLLFFMANIALVLQLKAVGYAILAERYTYLSYFGLLFIAANAWYVLWSKYAGQARTMLLAAPVLIALVFGIMTYQYTGVWKDDETLWTATIDKYAPTPMKYIYYAYVNRALAYNRQEKVDLALADFSKALELAPRYVEAYTDRGSAYMKQLKIDLALADFTKALSIDSTYYGAYYNRGLAYMKAGKPELAIADYSQALKLSPKYTEVFNNRGIAYANEGKPDMAIADFTAAIQLNPQYVEAYNNRGIAYAGLQKRDLAIADYTSAIKLDSTYLEAYNNRGNAHLLDQQPGLAVIDYTAAIHLNPNYLDAFTNRGNAYSGLGKTDLAIHDFSQVIRLSPNNVQAYNYRGNAYAMQGKYDLAIDDYTTAIKLNPTYAQAYTNRAIAEQKSGNNAAAQADIQKANSLSAGH